MALAPGGKRNTKEKIVDVAIDLFTESGIANVSTNHIASAMGISPGNLYYHFRNKEDILWRVLMRCSEAMARLFGSPDEEVVDVTRFRRYFEEAIGILHDYRFFFENKVGLARESTRLEVALRALEQENIDKLVRIYTTLVKSGVMSGPTNRDDMDALANNSWIIFTNWLNFLHTCRGIADASAEDRTKGLFHVYALFRPYVTEEADRQIRTLFTEKSEG